jgi:hypothetical protein
MATEIDDLYERDFYSWTRREAEALRKAARERVNTSEPIDWGHVAEEIEDMGSEQAEKLESVYRILLLHLLKWQFQPDGRSSSWRGSIVEHRRRAEKQVRRNPGLKPRAAELFMEAYDDARAIAAAETDLPLDDIPASCPYTVEQALDDGFWPEPPERSRQP